MNDPNIEVIDLELDLVFSPDDDGYYFQRYPDGMMSQLFPYKETAMTAYKEGTLEWRA